MKLHIDRDIANWQFGEQFITMLCDLGPQFLLDRVGNMERRTKPFENIAQCRPYWGGTKRLVREDGTAFDYYDDFVWTRRKKVKTSGIVSHTFHRQRLNETDPASIWVDYDFELKADWKQVFARFCTLCKPMYAMLHPFDGIEFTYGTEEVRRDHFRYGGYHWHLEKEQFPNLAWINLFGGKFRNLANRAALERDGFYTESIGDGWLLQLTPNIADVHSDYQRFVEIRMKAKRHFPDRFFLIPD